MATRKKKKTEPPKKMSLVDRVLGIGVLLLFLWMMGYMFAPAMGMTSSAEPSKATQIIISNYDKEEGRDLREGKREQEELKQVTGEFSLQGDITALNKVLPKYAHTNEIYQRDGETYVEVVCVFKATSLRHATRAAERRLKLGSKRK